MKKTLIALAAVAVSTGAMAQATISGTLDFSAQNNGKTTLTAKDGTAQANTKTTNRAREGWGVSQIVFSATEDLGGGLKATALVSQRATTGFAERDTHITLAGGFGSVRLGRFTPATDGSGAFSGQGTTMTAGSLDNFASGANLINTPSGANADKTTSAADGGDHRRQSGLIQYTSPNFNGLTATVVYGNNTSDSDATAATGKARINQQGIALAYTQGALRVGLGMSDRKVETEGVAAVVARCAPVGGTAVVDSTVTGGLTCQNETTIVAAGSAAKASSKTKSDKDWIGASYNFGVATVSGVHLKRKDATDGVTGTDIKLNSIGVMVPMGAITVRASTYSGKDNRGTGAADDAKLSGNQISVTYALSKRTFAYFVTGKNEIKRKTGTDVVARKDTGTSVGIVHNF